LKKLYSVPNLLLILFAAGALNAQTVTVDKSSLSFSTQSGGSAQSQTLAVSSSSSTAVTFSAFANASWLKLRQQSDIGAPQQFAFSLSTPTTLVIFADPTGLAVGGPYTGTVQIAPAGGAPAVVINVSMTVSTIGASPSQLTFGYQANGSLPNPATLTLTAAANTTYTAAATTTPANWLALPSSGTAPGTLAVALNAAVVQALAPGTYNGSVTITPSSGGASTIPVTLTVSGAPTVTASPASALNLNYQIGGATGSTNTPTATLTLSNPGIQDLAFGISPTPNGSWLSVNPASGFIPANGSIAVAVSYLPASNLPAGTFTGSLAVFIPGATNTQINVPVRLLVSTSPLLNVPGATLAFNYQIGGTTPAPKNVVATSSSVAVDATSGQMALLITKNDNAATWLNIPSSGQTGNATPIPVAVNPAGLAVGTYNASISVFGGGAANNPQTIPVTLTVSNDPLIVATFSGCSTANNTCPLLFPIQTGQNSPTTQTIRVTSSTGVQASFAAAVTMDASPACGTGWLSSGATAAVLGTESSFPITVTPGSIAVNTTCTGSITITGTNASGAALPNSPVTIPVTMYISANSMLAPSIAGMNFNLAPNASISQTFTVASTSSTNLSFAVTPATGANWLLAFPNSNVSTAQGSNTVTVLANSSGLAPGTYTSAVTLTAAGVLNSPVTIPVSLTVTAATLSATPATLTFSQTLGAAAPASKTFAVSTSSADIAFNTTVTMDNGTGWLAATPVSGTATSATPVTVTVNANGSSLAAGTYTGTVTLTATTPFVAGSPTTVKVTLTVAPGTLSATPASLAFAQVQNGPAPASQTISVAGTPGPLAYTVTATTNNNSGNWITVSPASGTSPSDVKVTVNGASLAPGDYTGKVTITSTGATGSPIDIPVTLKVSTSQTLTVTPATLNLTYVLGTPNTPQPQTVQLTASGAGVTFTTTTTVSAGGNWLSVTPSSGSAPATLTINTNTTGLLAGSYTGTIAVNSPNAVTQPAATITVNLSVLAVPKPVLAAVQNAASALIGAVSPGENIVIYGTGIGPATLAMGHVTSNLFDTTVANTRVLFDGVAAPIIYVRSDQTSVMVPYFVGRGPSTSVVIEYLGVQSSPITLSVTAAAPGIYTLNQAGSGQGAILNQDLTVNAASNRAGPGSVVAIYMTGEGSTSPAGVDGGIAGLNSFLAKPILPVTATVGGAPATVEYYGSAPSLIYGVMQVNIRIPEGQSGANVPIVINVGSNPSQTGVTVAIQ
jgi:uncharacterized protein (TIGR03437 family)